VAKSWQSHGPVKDGSAPGVVLTPLQVPRAAPTASLSRTTLRAGGTTLSEQTPDPLPPELAPFVARAQAHLEEATEGLDADATIAHLEATMARAEVEASRLGFRFPPPEVTVDRANLGDESNPVVLIQRLTDDG
jgi:hypothetical protein